MQINDKNYKLLENLTGAKCLFNDEKVIVLAVDREYLSESAINMLDNNTVKHFFSHPEADEINIEECLERDPLSNYSIFELKIDKNDK